MSEPKTNGRPSLYTPDVAFRLGCWLSRGETIEAAAAYSGVSAATLHRWIARGKAGDPEFLVVYQATILDPNEEADADAFETD